MTKRAESKYKINRRLGVNLWGRAKSPIAKREYGPGQHGQRRKKATDFGTQLMAKQKLKGYYGNISEKQFRKYYEEAIRRRGDTSEKLIELLERRLDAVCYRMKFAITPFAARQFVNHGHIAVNGKRVNIPSYLVQGQRHDRGEGKVEAACRGAGCIAEHRTRRARVSGSGSSRHEGPLRARAEAVRRAVSGADGTEPGGRVLLAIRKPLPLRGRGRDAQRRG